MAGMVALEARDGHRLDAYRATPADATAGVVVIQEIFGLTAHVRRVVDRYAAAGFDTIAPAMFDRLERGIVLGYSEIQQGLAHMRRLEWPSTLLDVEAAMAAVGEGGRKVAAVGFCWGGTVVHVAASTLPLAAGVAYYGGGIARMLDKQPSCPVMYHFGDQDHSIPLADVEAIRRANPDAAFHVYQGAGHGFNCEDRASYSERDATFAFERSVAFLRERLA